MLIVNRSRVSLYRRIQSLLLIFFLYNYYIYVDTALIQRGETSPLKAVQKVGSALGRHADATGNVLFILASYLIRLIAPTAYAIARFTVNFTIIPLADKLGQNPGLLRFNRGMQTYLSLISYAGSPFNREYLSLFVLAALSMPLTVFKQLSTLTFDVWTDPDLSVISKLKAIPLIFIKFIGEYCFSESKANLIAIINLSRRLYSYVRFILHIVRYSLVETDLYESILGLFFDSTAFISMAFGRGFGFYLTKLYECIRYAIYLSLGIDAANLIEWILLIKPLYDVLVNRTVPYIQYTQKKTVPTLFYVIIRYIPFVGWIYRRGINTALFMLFKYGFFSFIFLFTMRLCEPWIYYSVRRLLYYAPRPSQINLNRLTKDLDKIRTYYKQCRAHIQNPGAARAAPVVPDTPHLSMFLSTLQRADLTLFSRASTGFYSTFKDDVTAYDYLQHLCVLLPAGPSRINTSINSFLAAFTRINFSKANAKIEQFRTLVNTTFNSATQIQTSGVLDTTIPANQLAQRYRPGLSGLTQHPTLVLQGLDERGQNNAIIQHRQALRHWQEQYPDKNHTLVYSICGEMPTRPLLQPTIHSRHNNVTATNMYIIPSTAADTTYDPLEIHYIINYLRLKVSKQNILELLTHTFIKESALTLNSYNSTYHETHSFLKAGITNENYVWVPHSPNTPTMYSQLEDLVLASGIVQQYTMLKQNLDETDRNAESGMRLRMRAIHDGNRKLVELDHNLDDAIITLGMRDYFDFAQKRRAYGYVINLPPLPHFMYYALYFSSDTEKETFLRVITSMVQEQNLIHSNSPYHSLIYALLQNTNYIINTNADQLCRWNTTVVPSRRAKSRTDKISSCKSILRYVLTRPIDAERQNADLVTIHRMLLIPFIHMYSAHKGGKSEVNCYGIIDYLLRFLTPFWSIPNLVTRDSAMLYLHNLATHTYAYTRLYPAMDLADKIKQTLAPHSVDTLTGTRRIFTYPYTSFKSSNSFLTAICPNIVATCELGVVNPLNDPQSLLQQIQDRNHNSRQEITREDVPGMPGDTDLALLNESVMYNTYLSAIEDSAHLSNVLERLITYMSRSTDTDAVDRTNTPNWTKWTKLKLMYQYIANDTSMLDAVYYHNVSKDATLCYLITALIFSGISYIEHYLAGPFVQTIIWPIYCTTTLWHCAFTGNLFFFKLLLNKLIGLNELGTHTAVILVSLVLQYIQNRLLRYSLRHTYTVYKAFIEGTGEQALHVKFRAIHRSREQSSNYTRSNYGIYLLYLFLYGPHVREIYLFLIKLAFTHLKTVAKTFYANNSLAIATLKVVTGVVGQSFTTALSMNALLVARILVAIFMLFMFIKLIDLIITMLVPNRANYGWFTTFCLLLFNSINLCRSLSVKLFIFCLEPFFGPNWTFMLRFLLLTNLKQNLINLLTIVPQALLNTTIPIAEIIDQLIQSIIVSPLYNLYRRFIQDIRASPLYLVYYYCIRPQLYRTPKTVLECVYKIAPVRLISHILAKSLATVLLVPYSLIVRLLGFKQTQLAQFKKNLDGRAIKDGLKSTDIGFNGYLIPGSSKTNIGYQLPVTNAEEVNANTIINTLLNQPDVNSIYSTLQMSPYGEYIVVETLNKLEGDSVKIAQMSTLLAKLLNVPYIASQHYKLIFYLLNSLIDLHVNANKSKFTKQLDIRTDISEVSKRIETQGHVAIANKKTIEDLTKLVTDNVRLGLNNYSYIVKNTYYTMIAVLYGTLLHRFPDCTIGETASLYRDDVYEFIRLPIPPSANAYIRTVNTSRTLILLSTYSHNTEYAPCWYFNMKTSIDNILTGAFPMRGIKLTPYYFYTTKDSWTAYKENLVNYNTGSRRGQADNQLSTAFYKDKINASMALVTELLKSRLKEYNETLMRLTELEDSMTELRTIIYSITLNHAPYEPILDKLELSVSKVLNNSRYRLLKLTELVAGADISFEHLCDALTDCIETTYYELIIIDEIWTELNSALVSNDMWRTFVHYIERGNVQISVFQMYLFWYGNFIWNWTRFMPYFAIYFLNNVNSIDTGILLNVDHSIYEIITNYEKSLLGQRIHIREGRYTKSFETEPGGFITDAFTDLTELTSYYEVAKVEFTDMLHIYTRGYR